MADFQESLEQSGLPDGRGFIGWNLLTNPKSSRWLVPVWAELVPGPSLMPEVWEGRDLSGPWVICAWRDSDIDAGAYKWAASDVSGMLDRFIAIVGKDDSHVLAYVRKWGPLPLCLHLLPQQHAAGCDGSADTLGRSDTLGRLGDSGRQYPTPPVNFTTWQPVAAIRHWAQHFRSLVALTLDLSEGRTGSEEDWRNVYEWEPGNQPDRQREATARQQAALGKSLVTEREQQLLGLLDYRLYSVWDIDQPGPFLFTKADHFSTLALQLVHALAEGAFRAICSEPTCGRPYSSNRMPSAGRPHYCPDCGANAAKRGWNRRHPEKRRRARKEAGQEEEHTDGDE